MKYLLSGALSLVLFVAPAAAQDTFSSLEELMTGSEFEAAGLDELSPRELENLNNWLKTHIEASASAPAYVGEPGFEDKDEQAREEFRATIVGEFSGWTGNTVFELDNGQVWKQTSGGSYRVSMMDPVVVLYPAAFGAWRMRLEDYGPSIGVIRIK